MPIYSFSNPNTGEIKEIFFHMTDEVKEYRGKDGTKWDRVWSSPQLNTQGSIDPWNNADFVNKTTGKGTMGDLLDRSKELSDQRAQEAGGKDPIKEKYYKKYAKDRGGAPHPDKMKKTFENKNIKIELD